MKIRLTAGGALLAATMLTMATPGPASAATLPPGLSQFAHCPVDVPGVATCLYSSTSTTTFVIGSTTVATTSPTSVSLGLRYTKSGQAVAVLPVDGTSALTASPTPIPGGLTGIPGLDGGVLQVTATPQLVGKPTVVLANLLSAKGTGLALPLDILVSTPTGLLGPSCTIGDRTSPVELQLTTGTTSPPPPNTPISGAVGSVTSSSNGVITDTGLTLVDNSFAVPGADNCGIAGVLDPVLDLDKGLPSPAGHNTARLSGSSTLAPASLIRKYLH
jgi:hypothetical protein